MFRIPLAGNRLFLLTLLSLVLAPVAATQGSGASVPGFDCDPIWNATVDDAHACDGAAVAQTDGFGYQRLSPTLAPVQSRAEANRVLVQQAYADFAAGDVPAFLAVLDPHVTWTDAEGYPYAGTYVGPNAVVQGVIARIGAEWDDYAVVPNAFVADGNRVVVLGDYSGTYKATGHSVEAPFAHVWQVIDGAVVSFRQFTDGPPWQRAVTP